MTALDPDRLIYLRDSWPGQDTEDLIARYQNDPYGYERVYDTLSKNPNLNVAQSRQGNAVTMAMPQPSGSTASPTTQVSGIDPTMGAVPVYASAEEDRFRAAFLSAYGRTVTDAELNNIGYLSTLPNELVRLLPPDTLAQMSVEKLSTFSNADLDAVFRTHPEILTDFPTERLLAFDAAYIQLFISNLEARGDYSSNPKVRDLATNLRQSLQTQGSPVPAPRPPDATPPPDGSAPAQPEPPGAPPPPSGDGTPPPPGTAAPAVDLPNTHAWVIEIGAQGIVATLRAEGVDWPDITLTKVRAKTKALWDTLAKDPKYKSIATYAQQYYATTGWWPTSVELNRYTQNLPDVPNFLLNDDGTGTLIPKNTARKEGELAKWTVPTSPLPPGYEWRFSSDGTPIPFDNDQRERDVFSGWYQNPTDGTWSYNPFYGAADYLQFDPNTQVNWSDLVGGFISRTGKLPTLEESRQLAAKMWATADAATMARASQFATLNGFWPTPFELEHGPAKDKDANAAGTGTSGQAGLGQVPVFVPGIGAVLTSGTAMSPGSFVLDPFEGIPSAIRPWVRSFLNGEVTLDQLPKVPGADGQDILRRWVDFSLAKFRTQLPVSAPEDLPFGIPSPNIAGPNDRADAKQLTQQLTDLRNVRAEESIDQFNAAFERTYGRKPTAEDTSPDQIGGLAPEIVGLLPKSRLTGLPTATIASLGNDVIEKRLPERIGSLPPERVGRLNPTIVDQNVTDEATRYKLGLASTYGAMVKPETVAVSGTIPPAAAAAASPSLIVQWSQYLQTPEARTGGDAGFEAWRRQKGYLVGVTTGAADGGPRPKPWETPGAADGGTRPLPAPAGPFTKPWETPGGTDTTTDRPLPAPSTGFFPDPGRSTTTTTAAPPATAPVAPPSLIVQWSKYLQTSDSASKGDAGFADWRKQQGYL